MRYRRTAAPVYALGASILLVVSLVTWVVVQELQHDREVAQLSLERQQDTNRFFREVCDRFEIRDEIVLNIMRDAYLRALSRGERVYAASLERSILGLERAQGDCLEEIPAIRRPAGAASS